MEKNLLIEETDAYCLEYYPVVFIPTLFKIDVTDLYELFIKTLCCSDVLSMDKLAFFKVTIESIVTMLRVYPDNLIFEELVNEVVANCEFIAPIYGKEDESSSLYYELLYYHSTPLSAILGTFINELKLNGADPEKVIPFKWVTVNDHIALILAEHIEKEGDE